MKWWIPDINEVLQQLETSEQGLSDKTAHERLLKEGKNELEQKKRKPAWKIFFGQFKDFMILVLLVAAIVSGIAGDTTDTIIIFVIIVLNGVVGFVQESKAENAMEALRNISAPQAHVTRNGKSKTIPAAELVPGDIVTLDAGSIVPADLRLIEAHSVRINESALTGESVAVEKSIRPIAQEDLPPGDRLNMAFKSTLVTNGRARGVVVLTGMNTEIGSIAKMLDQPEEATPLQKRMADFGRKLSYVIITVCALFFVIGYFLHKEETRELLLTSISLAVAAIPEALPALITVALAVGAKRLVKNQALIRKLSAVETLGSVTYICSDKTGTLTQNKMKVIKVQSEDKEFHGGLNILECSMALNHDIKFQGTELRGDPTEIAMVEYFIEKNKRASFDELNKDLKRVAELPFDSDRKRMTTAHRFDSRILIISKGAIEAFNEPAHMQQAVEMSKDGLRVIAFAYKIVDHLPAPFTIDNVEKDFSFAGLAGMMDPPREEVKAAIAECKTAGITTVMITGDHPETAAAIARQLNILGKDDIAMSGKELQSLNDEDFSAKVEQVRVYARVTPEQKLKIVKALQAKNHFVSMTGDGVNDSPSLKAADIGVAMGITGTDVTKEASDMILLDDNFTTIVKAVREGRHIYDNIRKFVKYIMTCNSAEILTMFVAPIIGLPVPLLPIHILWINLVTDGLPGLALGSEQAEPDTMKRPPRKSDESLFSGGIGAHIVWVGILMSAVTIGTQAWSLDKQLPHWQTMVFTVLSFSQLAHVMAIRSERQSLFTIGLLSNRPLLGAVALTTALQLSVTYVPFANKVFKTQPLTLAEMSICIGASMVVLIAVEIEKLFRRNNFR